MVMGEEPIIGMKEVQKDGEKRSPPWLEPLLTTNFFVQCKAHIGSNKRECNMYCLDCFNGALCSLCLSQDHHNHHTIQIRRSSYHDVIRAVEIQKVFDISRVQTYVINSARVVFLNPRPQPRPPKTAAASPCCHTCFRSLLDSFNFYCSLACKIAGNSNEDHCKTNGKKGKIDASETESYSGSGQESGRNTVVESFNPSTPPPTSVSYQTGPTKRRKGIPHRSSFGGLLLEV
ncbi:hypothetical protein LUZ63_002653 [Rhynchospora breviuscula]|uniref:PLATZ transcription factor family protein n=1 Tax=Rhynchospora breviuscula TaxID=2022672 RepID=A0A9Q0D0I7_9POAL|nr:hypothetical protein LUZ63_002653 [Rhynchospora breviuscula]